MRKFNHNTQMKHMAMGMAPIIIIISHKISFYLLKISVRNKLRNSKMMLVNQSQNLRTEIYCDIKQKHVSVAAYGPYYICNSIKCSQLAYADIPLRKISSFCQPILSQKLTLQYHPCQDSPMSSEASNLIILHL